MVFPRGLVIKNLPIMQETACNAGDSGLIPGSGICPGEGKTSHSSILAWEIPWTEKPGGLPSIWTQKSQT